MTRLITGSILLLVVLSGAAMTVDAAVHPDFLKAQKFEADGNYKDAVPIYRRLYASEGTDIYFWRLVLLYEKAGMYHELADFTRERLADDPGDTESARYLARALFALGEREKGRELLFDLFERDGRSRNMAVFAANEFISNGEYGLALDVYQSARQAAGDNSMFAIESARVYEAIEKYILAVEEYLRVIDTIPTAYQRIVNTISSARKSGAGYVEFYRPLETNLKNAPGSIKTARLLSDMLYTDGKHHEALVVLSGAVEKSGSHADLRAMADRLMTDGVPDVALTAYETYARLFPEAPDRPSILLRSADLARDLDRAVDASGYLQQVIDDYSGTVHSAYATVQMISASEEVLGETRFSSMLTEFAETTEFREAAFRAYHILGESHLRDNRPGEAKDAFRNAGIKARTGEERYSLAVIMTRRAFFTGDNEAMTQEIMTVMRNQPAAPEVNELLADKVLGMRCATTVDAAAFRTYAEARYALYRGEIQEAVDKFIAVADTSSIVAPVAALRLGDMYAGSGDNDNALEWYGRAMNAAADTTGKVLAQLKIADMTRLLPDGGEKAKSMYLEMLTTYPGTVYDEELRSRLKTMVER